MEGGAGVREWEGLVPGSGRSLVTGGVVLAMWSGVDDKK